MLPRYPGQHLGAILASVPFLYPLSISPAVLLVPPMHALLPDIQSPVFIEYLL